jgi:hypothetical protein
MDKIVDMLRSPNMDMVKLGVITLLNTVTSAKQVKDFFAKHNNGSVFFPLNDEIRAGNRPVDLYVKGNIQISIYYTLIACSGSTVINGSYKLHRYD